MKKWKISNDCLDIIKQESPYYQTPVLLNTLEVFPSRHIHVLGHNITTYVWTPHRSTDRYTVQSSLKRCEKLLNDQLNDLRPKFKEIADQINQNQIDAIASCLQSMWIELESEHTIIDEFLKTRFFKSMKIDKFERASNDLSNHTSFYFPRYYPEEVVRDNDKNELGKRRRKECRLFDTTQEEAKSNLPDSNMFALAKKMKNPKERAKFIKQFMSI